MMYVQHINSFAHIQDLGRFGLRRFGIGHAGAMDKLALQAGNLLLHNTEHAPALEIALGGLTLTFDCDTPFCFTGALVEAELDGMPVFPYWRYTAKARQTLVLKRIVQGNYAYLCVAGGFLVPAVLNACSTDLKAGFGGIEGRLVKAGDILASVRRDQTLSPLGIEPIPFTNRIHAMPSSEYDAFSTESQQRFWQQGWILQPNSNRMGYRLKNWQNLTFSHPLEMLSYAAPEGTVQVPPDGQPIVLMADTQTTGGYPKIACIASADLGRFAQNLFGSTLYFEPINREQAVALHQKNIQYLNSIRRLTNETR